MTKLLPPPLPVTLPILVSLPLHLPAPSAQLLITVYVSVSRLEDRLREQINGARKETKSQAALIAFLLSLVDHPTTELYSDFEKISWVGSSQPYRNPSSQSKAFTPCTPKERQKVIEGKECQSGNRKSQEVHQHLQLSDKAAYCRLPAKCSDMY
mmetsp:Transcript_43467/g.85769  ORF Transcript_43467/g.85769 Transcript_43467/m.85769 type:complete len:154 (-) Transcript_43467:90-551(-)